MGLDFLILFLLAVAFFWYAGKVVDDVLEDADREWERWRERDDWKKRVR